MLDTYEHVGKSMAVVVPCGVASFRVIMSVVYIVSYPQIGLYTNTVGMVTFLNRKVKNKFKLVHNPLKIITVNLL